MSNDKAFPTEETQDPRVLLEQHRFQRHDELLAINSSFAKLAAQYRPSAGTDEQFSALVARFTQPSAQQQQPVIAFSSAGIEIDDEDMVMHSPPPAPPPPATATRKSKRTTAHPPRKRARIPLIPRHKPLEPVKHPKPGARFVVNHYPELYRRKRRRGVVSAELDINMLALAAKIVRDSGRTWGPVDKVVLSKNLKRAKREVWRIGDI